VCARFYEIEISKDVDAAASMLVAAALHTAPALRGYVKRIVLREGVFAEYAFEHPCYAAIPSS
jgi:hypothetical protein